jgi:hypothetical protein
MTTDIHRLIQQHRISYEVSPYYVINYDHRDGASPRKVRVQAGFDIDLYGSGIDRDLSLSPDSEQALLTYRDLEEVARTIMQQVSAPQIVEILPFTSALYVLPSHRFRTEALLKIRITHGRGLDQPSGPFEEQALKALEERLQAFGATSGRGTTF